MTKWILLAVAALSLGTADIAIAQDASTRAAGERLAALQAILSEPDGVPALFDSPAMVRARNARDFREVAAAMRSLQPDIDRERAKLQAMVSRLQALPAMGSDNDQARLLDQAVRDAIRSKEDMNRFLAELETIPEVIDAGDPENTRRALLKLTGGGLVMIDSRSLMLKTRAAMIPSNLSEQASGLAAGGIYEGVGQIMRGAFGLSSAEDTATALDSTTAALDADIVRGRAMLAEETELVSNMAPGDQREVGLQLMELQSQMFSVYADGLTLLNRARHAALQNSTPQAFPARMFEIANEFTPIEGRLISINNAAGPLMVRLRQ